MVGLNLQMPTRHPHVRGAASAAVLLLAALAAAGCLSPSQAGPGDCSDSSALGGWHQTNAPDSWNREDITFYSDCSVLGEEYEGNLYESGGWFIQQGDNVAIDFYDWTDRTGSIRGDMLEIRKAQSVISWT